jgi:hypothetical protein
MSTWQFLDKQLELARMLSAAVPGNLDDVGERVERLGELVTNLHRFLDCSEPPALPDTDAHEAAMQAMYEGTVHWIRRGHYRVGVLPHNDVVIIARKPQGLPADLQVQRLSEWLDEVHATCQGQSATATMLRELAQRVEEHVARSGNLYQRLVGEPITQA